MSRPSSTAFFFLCVSLLIRDFSNCCTDSELIHGCRPEKAISGMECLCGVGCKKEFPYKTRTECETNIKSGQALNRNPCQPNPCLNGGHCIQLKFGHFRCECTGTNFYGESCHQACPPRIGVNAFGYVDPDLPLDCMVI